MSNRDAKRRQKVRANIANKRKYALDKWAQNVKDAIAKAHDKYSSEWSTSAEALDVEGCYQWMVNRIQGFERVLEIGTGDGRGTLAMASAGHKIISIDENPSCLQSAYQRLTNAGIKSTLILRGSVEPHVGGGYSVEYDTIDEPSIESGVTLIEGDTLADDALQEWLVKCGEFDAVTCWLIGTHGVRATNTKINGNLAKIPRNYRLMVQNPTYLLANDLLRDQGILSVVDRGEKLTEQLLVDDIRRAHEEQAASTTLTVEIIEDFAIRSLGPTSGVEMVQSPVLSGRIPNKPQFALVSVMSKKHRIS